ncbi:hypothetical protein V1478_006535 [Vespula squamosa]|uniref:Uncharacterized protein n=1 Tax=Vespula squamosa TaxID=30214 RepID=A0ABD2B856_VESSQ
MVGNRLSNEKDGLVESLNNSRSISVSSTSSFFTTPEAKLRTMKREHSPASDRPSKTCVTKRFSISLCSFTAYKRNYVAGRNHDDKLSTHFAVCERARTTATTTATTATVAATIAEGKKPRLRQRKRHKRFF